MTASIEEAALAWYDAGASVLPAVRGKRPAWAWQEHQHTRAEVVDWSDFSGFGIVTGYGGFEMFELEGAAVEEGLHVELLRKIPESLVAKLMTYAERTPSGGIHWIYRLEGEQEGSQKLARSINGKTLIETRGKYAWTIVAPSDSSIHEEGIGSWQIISGAPGVVATLTEEEQAQLFDAARELDRLPPPEPVEHRAALQVPADGSLAPGQDYEARTDWASILEPLGWKRHPRGDAWTRPGKRFGISATITPSDNLYIWSSSVSPLEPEQSYTKFRFRSLMMHGGDDAEAARQLRASGFGSPPAERIMIVSEQGLRSQRDEPARSAAESLSNQDQQAGGASPTDPPLTGDPGPLGGDYGPTAEQGQSVSEGSESQVSITLTEDGNARLLAAAAKNKLLYVPENKVWLAWDGARWHEESDDASAVMTLRNMMVEWSPTDKNEQKHRFASLGARSLNNVVGLAKKDPLIRASIHELDADPLKLNTRDGVINLLTSEVTPPDPNQLHTKITRVGVSFDPPLRFLAFLHETFSMARDSKAMIEFIQRLAGYSTTGIVTHHVLPFLHGVGNNGKTVVLEIFQSILGDYSGTAPTDLLLATGKEDFAAQAELHGKRLVVCSEIPPTARFHEERAKKLTGGDRVSARRLYANYFEFVPSHHLWLAGNHQPQVPAGGSSFWRRLRLVPFDHVVPDDRIVQGLAQILVREEGPQILGWMIQGARKQMDIRKLAEPAEVMTATSAYAEEEDHLGRFVDERCEIGGGHMAKEPTDAVGRAYRAWCERQGQRPMHPNPFGRELRNRFKLGDAKSNGRKLYTNIRLKSPEMSIEDDTAYQPPLT